MEEPSDFVGDRPGPVAAERQKHCVSRDREIQFLLIAVRLIPGFRETQSKLSCPFPIV
jgi:hypothetical protein